jgi:DNA-binding transcriptional LysR family regulator
MLSSPVDHCAPTARPGRDAPLPIALSSARSLSSRQLDLIIGISQSDSLRSASGRIGLSQSALTRQIQLMESRLGVKLVARHPAGIRLTEAGERLLSLAKLMKRLESELLFELDGGGGRLRGNVRLCGFSSVMRSAIQPALAPLLAAHPALTAQFITEELYLVANRGTTANADLLITQAPLRLAGYTAITIGHEYNLLIEPDDGSAAAVYIDHEPDDRFSEYYLSMIGVTPPQPMKRQFCGDIYGLIDGVRQRLGRAVVPAHLLAPAAGYRIAADCVPLRVPVVLNVQSSLLEFSALRAVVDALHSRAGGFLERNAMDADLAGAIEGAFVGPSHKFSD